MSTPSDLKGAPGISLVQAWLVQPRRWYAPWRGELWCARVALADEIAGGDVMPLSYGATSEDAIKAAAAVAMEFVHGPDWRRIAAENRAAGLGWPGARYAE